MLAKLRFALHGRRGLGLGRLHSSLSLQLLSFLLLPLVVEIVELSVILGGLRRVLRLTILQLLVLNHHLIHSLLLLHLSHGFLVLFDGLDVRRGRSNILTARLLHRDHFLRGGSLVASIRVEAVLLGTLSVNSDWRHVLLLLTSWRLKVVLVQHARHHTRLVGLHHADHGALLLLSSSLARKSLVHEHLLAEAVDLLSTVDVGRGQRVAILQPGAGRVLFVSATHLEDIRHDALTRLNLARSLGSGGSHTRVIHDLTSSLAELGLARVKASLGLCAVDVTHVQVVVACATSLRLVLVFSSKHSAVQIFFVFL